MTDKDMQKFMKSGKIIDYLNYANKKNKKDTEFSCEINKGEKNDIKGRKCNKNN